MNLPLTTEARQRQAQRITFKSTHQNFWKYQTKTSATLLTAQKHYPAATEQMLFKSVVNWTSTCLSSLKCKSSLNPTTTHSFMAALHISMSLLIPSGLNSHVDIQISIELKQQNRWTHIHPTQTSQGLKKHPHLLTITALQSSPIYDADLPPIPRAPPSRV